MTNIEQLMQNSEVMRMLKIGNPQRSKDFKQAELGIGLFDIERQLKEPLEQSVYSSPDPNGAIAKFDTALMLNNLGVDMETAHSMAEMGFSSSVTGIDTRDKNYWEALKTTAQHAHWQDMKGINTSLYRMTGDTKFLKFAEEYDMKARNNPVFESYGKFGDLVLDSVQPAMSSVKFMTTAALLSWIPGGIANKVWGSAVAKVIAQGGGVLATGVNWFSTGYSQAGNVLFEVMQTEDAEGNTLPWDSPAGGILFHSLGVLMGLTELGSMEMFPWYRQLRQQFTDREFVEHMSRGIIAAIKSIVWKGAAGTASEALEEGVQTLLENGYENALMALANKQGSSFDYHTLAESIHEAAIATYEGGKSMFLTSFLTAGFGQGISSARLRASTKKNFLSSKDSVPIDSSFINVPQQEIDRIDGDAVSGPIEPIRVVNVGTHLAPVDQSELSKAARAKKDGMGAMEVIVDEMAPMESIDQISTLNRAAVSTDAKILDGEKLGYTSEEEMNRAAYLLAPNTEAIERTDSGIEITIRSEEGKLSRIALALIEEGQEASDPDISYVDDPEAPYSLSRMTSERALLWQERKLIKDSIGDIVAHTAGRISSADLEANVDAVKLVAETLDIPTDQMLRENLIFKLERSSPRGERGAIENISIDGKKQYTIHLSEKADATTLLHEIGHFMRATASKQQLAEFTQIYGNGQQAVWIEDINKVGDRYYIGDQEFTSFEEAKKLVEANEEAFANDFVAYLRTGEAPTEALKNIFRRMKAVLQRFIREFGYELNPDVKQAFDRLLTGDTQAVQGSFGPIPVDAQGNVLFQSPEHESIRHRYQHTDQWMKAPNGNPTNLTEQQWIQVRTPSFKRWFGDWEATANYRWLMNTESIVDLTGNEFKENIVDAVEAFFSQTGNRVFREGLGEVSLTRHDIQGSIAHGLGRLKAAAFSSVPDVIASGREFRRVENYKGRGYTSITIAAPISIGGIEFVCEVVINQRQNSNNFYLHEVEVKEKLQFGNQVRNYMDEDRPNRNTKTGASKLIIAKLLSEGKFESSKVVDENGEPLMVFHGSPVSEITQFDRQGANGGERSLIYASDSEQTANDFSYEQLTGSSNLTFRPGRKGQVYPLYMNIQNPLDFRSLTTRDYENIRSAIEAYSVEKDAQQQALDQMMTRESVGHQYAKFVASDLLNHLSEYGYDGLVAEMRNGGPLEFAVTSPSQVKSIDNQGTWDSDNPSILLQPSLPVESAEFKAWFGDWEHNPENASKVVKDGRPLNVYNGVRTDPGDIYTSYANVRPEGGKFGFFFTPYYDVAKTYAFNKWESDERVYGPVKEVYLNIRNPLVLDRWMYTWDALKKELAEKHVDINQEVEWKKSFSTWNYFVSAPESEKAWVNAEELKAAIQEAGYDGVFFKDDSSIGDEFGGNKRMYHEDLKKLPDDAGIVYVPFSPNQIKSVNNLGKWDPDNPNVLYQRAHNPYRNWEPEITETGKIKGAPEWVKSRKDINSLRRLLRKLVREGESGRFWYEESADEVWRITQGNPENARKLIQLLAIYSPNNNVPNNTLMAIRAYNHWAAGLPEGELHSGMGELDNKAKRALYHDEDWIGRKTGSFYENLMYELVRKHPEAFPDIDISDVATMDLWMARAFGFMVEAFSDDKGSEKYSFSENSTRRLAAELNGQLDADAVAWTPHQIQAAIWSSMKTRYELPHVKAQTNKESVRKGYSTMEGGKVKNPTSGESERLHKQLWRKHALEDAGTSEVVTKLVEQAGFSFKEAIYDSSQIVTWESIPSTSLGHGITSASNDIKKQFTEEARSLIVDMEGKDLLAEKLGVALAFAARGDGAYEGAVTPNVLSNIFPTRVQGKELSFDTVRTYARAIQYIYKQDAVPFFKPNSIPISSKADQGELYFKVVKYTRNEQGEITKVSTIPRSKFESQAEAEAFRQEYLKNKTNLTSDDVQVHGGKFARAVVYTFKNALDDGILNEVLVELQQYLGDEVGYTRTGSNEITLINFRDDFTHAPWVHDEQFLDSLDFFNEDNKDRFGIVNADKIFTEGEYGPVYDWSESEREKTERDLEGSFSGRSDLHSWIRSRRALFEEILQRYSGEDLQRIEGESRSVGSIPEGDVLFQDKPSELLNDNGQRNLHTRTSLDREALTQVDPSNTLYQLSEDAKQDLLNARKDEVRLAVQNFYWIPDDVLQEYIGEPWADNEIAFRKHLQTYPWILEESRKFSDTDEFLEHLQSNTEMGDYTWVLEDELWFKRVHAYARIMSPKDKDSQFVRLHTGTDKALVELGRRLRGYEDVQIKRNFNRRNYNGDHVVFRWGAFKGVSPIVKRLNKDSSAEELQRARKLIQDNPRPYRKALQVIDQAQNRVLEMKGLVPDSEATRDAYYDMLGEEMDEALNEPLLLNQMTDRQAAEYLRTTEDRRERYDAREKLATHAGVIAMEQQANAELKRLGAEKDQDINKAKKELSRAQSALKEVSDSLKDEKKALRTTQSALDKERARAWELVEKLDEKSKQASRVGQLERNLADRRNRVSQLRKELTVKNDEIRSIRKKVDTLNTKLKNQKLLKALEDLHEKILATVKFNSELVDASFEEAFMAISRLLNQNQDPGSWEMLPEQMRQYLSDVSLHWIQQGRKINKWTLGELETLFEAARMMRMDAKVMLERKKLQRMDRLQNIASQLYKQVYGELPEVGPGYGSLMNDIIDDLMLKRDTYDENIFDAMFNTIRASIGKMQRIARMLDGNQEGVAYQLLVRDAYDRMTEELRESYRRLQDADAKMQELKITNDYLAKKAFTYTTPSGQEKTLSKGEVIGLYVYSQNPMGSQKLIHSWGNNIPYDQLATAIGTLSSRDKAWGDYMIDSLGGDEVWTRMKDTYYEVYNRNLGRRKRYFTFVADGKVDEGKTDLLVGPKGSKIRYVDKDFTKIANPHAVYPLKLNVTHTFTSQIKKQEHFIQWADWTRDMNYLLTKGAVGRIIEMNHGPKFLNAVQEYVNDVGSPQVILDDIERIGSKIISNAAVAALSLNFLTMLKQLPSFSAALRGDIGAMELTNVALRLTNPKTHAEAVKFIHEMSPYMLKRSISVEVEKYNASDFDSYLGRKIQAFNEHIGMKGIHLMDQAAVNTLWLAAYDTYVRRNPKGLKEEALKQEAAFRATQLISETQPTSIANDLSSIQRKKSPFTRAFLLFSNQIFQYINMVWYDLPTSVKAYIATRNPQELRKMFGIVMNMAVSGGMIMLVSGVAFRGDDDDEKYWERIKREILKMTASYTLPIVGNAVSQGVSGFYGGDLVDLPTAFGRMMGAAVTDWDQMNKRIWDLLDGIGSVGGLPTAFINRAIKSVQNENPLELLGSAYGDLWEAR